MVLLFTLVSGNKATGHILTQFSTVWSCFQVSEREVRFRDSGAHLYDDVKGKFDQDEPRSGKGSKSKQVDHLLCMSTVEMLYIMWILKQPPKIPEVQLTCETLVQDFYIHLANRACTFMIGMEDSMKRGNIKSMLVSTIKPGLANAKSSHLVSSYPYRVHVHPISKNWSCIYSHMRVYGVFDQPWCCQHLSKPVTVFPTSLYIHLHEISQTRLVRGDLQPLNSKEMHGICN